MFAPHFNRFTSFFLSAVLSILHTHVLGGAGPDHRGHDGAQSGPQASGRVHAVCPRCGGDCHRAPRGLRRGAGAIREKERVRHAELEK